MIEDIDTVRAQCDGYIQQAARMVRQSVVIAERTLGLDAPETIQQYTDLGILEQALGNFGLAMKFTKHAITLWASVYGLNHPGVHALLVSTRGCHLYAGSELELTSVVHAIRLW